MTSFELQQHSPSTMVLVIPFGQNFFVDLKGVPHLSVQMECSHRNAIPPINCHLLASVSWKIPSWNVINPLLPSEICPASAGCPSHCTACCPEHIDKNARLIRDGKAGEVVALCQQHGHLPAAKQCLQTVMDHKQVEPASDCSCTD